MTSSLEVRAVSRLLGSACRRCLALDACSFAADKGEILGVIGPNGAGKTTLLRLIAGEIPPSSGELMVLGHRAGTVAGRRAVGFASDPPLAPPELTGAEWLTYLASHRVSSPQERAHVVSWASEVAELNGFAGRRIRTLSRGMTQRLALAAAVATKGSVLVLDETLSGVDPLVQRRLRHQIANLASNGRLVIIASHDLATVERVATRVLVLSRGMIRADVRTTELVSERVAELTLSGSALANVEDVLRRFPDAVRTGQGIAVPLKGGAGVELVLATCRQHRIPVAASRIRYRALEDILVAAVGVEGETS
jgi:ABC-2 type transport system ATP-binding protein